MTDSANPRAARPTDMADLHPLAKQIHQASPAPLRLELSDGTSGVFRMGHTEWFQTEFQAEGTREGDDATYRFVTDGGLAAHQQRVAVGDEPVGRETADGWAAVGTVTAVSPVG